MGFNSGFKGLITNYLIHSNYDHIFTDCHDFADVHLQPEKRTSFLAPWHAYFITSFCYKTSLFAKDTGEVAAAYNCQW